MSQTKTVSVTVKTGGMRVDQFLAGLDDTKSRSAAKRMLEAGLVRMNGKKITKSSLLMRAGDVIEYTPTPAAPVPKKGKKTTPLSVLYEDDLCLVINKPSNLSVHPGSGMSADEETVLSALKPLFAKRKLSFSESEALVHRLDKDTTGCLLIAKTPKAHMAFQKQFATRTVEKKYLTLVAGIPEPAAAIIDAPVGRHATRRTEMSVHQATASRSARTTYRTLGVAEKSSGQSIALLECDLHTGRTHQIRVHLKTIGHSVLGDATYGNSVSKQVERANDIDFLCLHAWKLEFDSAKKKRVRVEAPLPEQFSKVLSKLHIDLSRKD